MRHKDLLIEEVVIPETRVTSYFDNEVYEQFKATIKTAGVLEPIIVVEVDKKYFLVDGLHRLLELKNAGEKKVPAVIVPGDEKAVFLTNLFLNVLRGKPRIAELRQVIELLYNDYKMGVDQIAKETGLGVRFIDDLLLIGKLPDPIQEAFDEGKLEKGKALALVRLPDAGAQVYIYEALQGKRLTTKDWGDYIEVYLGHRQAPAPAPAPEPVMPTTTSKCDVCNEEKELKWIQFVGICPECLGIMRLSIKEAAKAVTPSQAGPASG